MFLETKNALFFRPLIKTLDKKIKIRHIYQCLIFQIDLNVRVFKNEITFCLKSPCFWEQITPYFFDHLLKQRIKNEFRQIYECIKLQIALKVHIWGFF